MTAARNMDRFSYMPGNYLPQPVWGGPPCPGQAPYDPYYARTMRQGPMPGPSMMPGPHGPPFRPLQQIRPRPPPPDLGFFGGPLAVSHGGVQKPVRPRGNRGSQSTKRGPTAQQQGSHVPGQQQQHHAKKRKHHRRPTKGALHSATPFLPPNAPLVEGMLAPALRTPNLRAGWHSVTPNPHGSNWRNGPNADADMIERAAAAGIDMTLTNDDLLGPGDDIFDDDEPPGIHLAAANDAFNRRTQAESNSYIADLEEANMTLQEKVYVMERELRELRAHLQQGTVAASTQEGPGGAILRPATSATSASSVGSEGEGEEGSSGSEEDPEDGEGYTGSEEEHERRAASEGRHNVEQGQGLRGVEIDGQIAKEGHDAVVVEREVGSVPPAPGLLQS